MQRLFTMFPGGVPGLALVLLRLGVAGSLWQLILEGGPEMTCVRLFSLGTLSILLLLGFATPLIGLIASAVQLLRLFDAFRPGTAIPAEDVTVAVHAIFALSLALIGPGAFSLDARLFGRRTLITS
jgi:hypothetical protein